MAEYLLGVDPGLEGGWALLRPEPCRKRARLIASNVMPRLDGDPRRLDLAKLVRSWRGLMSGVWARPEMILAGIEAVDGSPQMGRSSAFAFGRAAGALEGLLVGLGVSEVVRVAPAVWKPRTGLRGGKAGKAASIALAEKLTGTKGLMGEHEAEAALIVWYVWNAQGLAAEREDVLT
jgi:hypothetical protein